MPKVSIDIPASIMKELEPILSERDLTLQQVIRVHLRSLVLSNKAGAALKLSDEIPFGKFKGEEVEVVIKTDPKYVSWLCKNVETFRLSHEAEELLLDILTGGNEVAADEDDDDTYFDG